MCDTGTPRSTRGASSDTVWCPCARTVSLYRANLPKGDTGMILWWSHRRGKPGTWLLRYVPENLIEYPFETLVSVWAMLSGSISVIYTGTPNSIAALMPDWVGTVWGGALLISGVSAAIGLRKRWYATLVPRGMQLAAVAMCFYATAILAVIGPSALPNVLLLITVAIIILLRAWYLQIREAIFLDIARESER